MVTGIGVANPLAGKTGTDLQALINNIFEGKSGITAIPGDFFKDSLIEDIRENALALILGYITSCFGHELGESTLRKIEKITLEDINFQSTAVALKAAAMFPRAAAYPVTADSSEQLRHIFENAGRIFKNPKKELKVLDPYVTIGISSAYEAIIDAFGHEYPEVLDSHYQDKSRRGAVVATALGPLTNILATYSIYAIKGEGKISPRMVPNLLTDRLSAVIASGFSFMGDTPAIVHACASGSSSTGYLFRAIRDGYLDMGVAGGSEFASNGMPLTGFVRGMAIANYDGKPEEASRPFAIDRCGFLPGEGSTMLVLEELKSALGRKAKIYGEILGFAMTNDASGESTAPTLEGPVLAMKNAIKDAGLIPDQIGYINTHGTSTQLNDANEIRAIKEVFGHHAEELYVNSTKSLLGHLMGASGTIEAAITLIQLQEKRLHATLNLTPQNLDPECSGVIHVMGKSLDVPDLLPYALSNAFGVGAQNAVLVLGRYENRDCV